MFRFANFIFDVFDHDCANVTRNDYEFWNESESDQLDVVYSNRVFLFLVYRCSIWTPSSSVALRLSNRSEISLGDFVWNVRDSYHLCDDVCSLEVFCLLYRLPHYYSMKMTTN